jgi:hypothetical protein
MFQIYNVLVEILLHVCNIIHFFLNVKSPLNIDFSQDLNQELGFKHTNFHLLGGFTPTSFVSRQLENKLKCISALFIYCNIIDYQFIGNTF